VKNEAEAKSFARTKLRDGLIVFAGTINPFTRHNARSAGVGWFQCLKATADAYVAQGKVYLLRWG
jgi:hypothetical protein